jgi:hypothetical protein
MSETLKVRLHQGLRNKVEKLLCGEVVEAFFAAGNGQGEIEIDLEGCDAVVLRGMTNGDVTVSESVLWVKPAEEEDAVEGWEPNEPECEDDASDEPLNPESCDSLVDDED